MEFVLRDATEMTSFVLFPRTVGTEAFLWSKFWENMFVLENTLAKCLYVPVWVVHITNLLCFITLLLDSALPPIKKQNVTRVATLQLLSQPSAETSHFIVDVLLR